MMTTMKRALAAGLVAFSSGCTRESVRQALEAQQRADEIQQAIFDRQQDGLRMLLFRDMEARLALAGEGLNESQQAVLNRAWNDRDLIEFWSIQEERSKALRLAGVDAKLFADQSVIDLLYKGLQAKVDRVRQGVAQEAGELAADSGAAAEASESGP